ncbi:anti-sigma factor family protein [Bacillus taeanensis]|uniref:Anti-sigma factor n=1 Tax=Bacillus taeanensis TaxID=273032 RepID=A0A366XNW0_9BACI|nr:anti-sigma factor [Bacillus taeanensis]RBW67802.1 anti-sigma factor [Bacillus taeanensis]
MKCEKTYMELIYKVLDHEATEQERTMLQDHLKSCSACQLYYQELKEVEIFLKGAEQIEVPEGFTTKVMNHLPKEKKTISLKRWFRTHPMLTAAALFFFLMAGSIYSSWNGDGERLSIVSGNGNLQINEERNVVIVPEGEVVKGDLIVKNGNIEIEGEVQGNVVIINGEKYMASAGQVTGEIEEVDQVMEWIWYHIKSGAKEIKNLFAGKDE